MEILKDVFPRAQFYSAREGADAKTLVPDILVWGVGRNREETMKWPPNHWHTKVVLDLNYSEDSPGREWSEKHTDTYLSGERFFREQAKLQRLWWDQQKVPASFLLVNENDFQ